MREQGEAWILKENLYFIEEIFCRSFTSRTVFILFLKCIHGIFVVFPSFSQVQNEICVLHIRKGRRHFADVCSFLYFCFASQRCAALVNSTQCKFSSAAIAEVIHKFLYQTHLIQWQH